MILHNIDWKFKKCIEIHRTGSLDLGAYIVFATNLILSTYFAVKWSARRVKKTKSPTSTTRFRSIMSITDNVLTWLPTQLLFIKKINILCIDK